jgi:uncharacterized RDD family membrane protein YckC
MSLVAQSVTLNSSFLMEKVIEFSPEALKAPFFLRIAAICIDYMVVLSVPILWLLGSKFFGDAGNGSIPDIVWLLAVMIWVIDFLLLPLFRGQTLGKMVSGITIVNIDGTPVRLGGLSRRHILGYFVTLATIGIGFFVSAVNRTGRSLHDYVGGTVVIAGRKRYA